MGEIEIFHYGSFKLLWHVHLSVWITERLANLGINIYPSLYS
jgi:hypothetical protein